MNTGNHEALIRPMMITVALSRHFLRIHLVQDLANYAEEVTP